MPSGSWCDLQLEQPPRLMYTKDGRVFVVTKYRPIPALNPEPGAPYVLQALAGFEITDDFNALTQECC